MAWGITGGTTRQVLFEYDDQKDQWGATVSQALFTSDETLTPPRIYAPSCLADYHYALGTLYRYRTYTENWNPTCALTGSQTKDGWIPTTFDAKSTNYKPASADATWYTCGN